MREFLKAYFALALFVGVPFGCVMVLHDALSLGAPSRPLWAWVGLVGVLGGLFGLSWSALFLALIYVLEKRCGMEAVWPPPFSTAPLPAAQPAEALGPAVEASWRTPTVLALARQVADGIDPTATAVLADALEEAGCADEGLLSRLRRSSPSAADRQLVEALLRAG
jgi:hypothetical protein